MSERYSFLLAEAAANATARPLLHALVSSVLVFSSFGSFIGEILSVQSQLNRQSQLANSGYYTILVTRPGPNTRQISTVSRFECESLGSLSAVRVAGLASSLELAQLGMDQGPTLAVWEVDLSILNSLETGDTGYSEFAVRPPVGIIVDRSVQSAFPGFIDSSTVIRTEIGELVGAVRSADLGSLGEGFSGSVLIPKESDAGDVCIAQATSHAVSTALEQSQVLFPAERGYQVSQALLGTEQIVNPTVAHANRPSRFIWAVAGLIAGLIAAFGYRVRLPELTLQRLLGLSTSDFRKLLIIEMLPPYIAASIGIAITGSLLRSAVDSTAIEVAVASGVLTLCVAALCQLLAVWLIARSDVLRSLRSS